MRNPEMHAQFLPKLFEIAYWLQINILLSTLSRKIELS